MIDRWVVVWGVACVVRTGHASNRPPADDATVDDIDADV